MRRRRRPQGCRQRGATQQRANVCGWALALVRTQPKGAHYQPSAGAHRDCAVYVEQWDAHGVPDGLVVTGRCPYKPCALCPVPGAVCPVRTDASGIPITLAPGKASLPCAVCTLTAVVPSWVGRIGNWLEGARGRSSQLSCPRSGQPSLPVAGGCPKDSQSLSLAHRTRAPVWREREGGGRGMGSARQGGGRGMGRRGTHFGSGRPRNPGAVRRSRR